MPDPTAVLKNARKYIKPSHRFAFLASLLSGLAVHLYMFSNMLLNHDTLMSFLNKNDMITSGRWFLVAACWPSTYLHLPWVIGLFSLFYLSLTSMVVAELFHMENRLSIALTSFIVVSFPAITSTFAYFFTADGYLLGILLAAVAVLLAQKWKWGFLPGALCLALSLGIYQAYISFAALLVFLLLVLAAMTPENTIKDVLQQILRYGLMAAMGAVLYVVILQVLLQVRGLEMNSYMNMDTLVSPAGSMVGIAFSNLAKVYSTFFASLFRLSGVWGISLRFLIPLSVAVLGAFLVLGMYKTKSYRCVWRMGLVGVLLLLTPLAANLPVLLAPYTHTIMQQPYCVLLIALAVGMERLQKQGDIPTVALKWASTLALVGLCFQFFLSANVVYNKMTIRQEKTYSYTGRIANRIETTPGYQPGMPVYFIFYPLEDPDNPMTQASMLDREFFFMAGTDGNSFIQSRDHLMFYLDTWHGFAGHWFNADDVTLEHLESTALQDGMQPFPQLSSTQIIDGILVVRL